MQDGAPPHVLCIVRQHLNQAFGEQWTGRAGPVNWPALSPDLIPLDIRFWGHRKTLVCPAPVSDLEVLQQRTENATEEIRVKRGIFARVRTSAQ
jgi:hypothetical protein